VSGVKADWHYGAPDLPGLDDDPFAEAPVEEVGTRVDLTIGVDGAQRSFRSRIRLLEVVENRTGVECSLMGEAGNDCRRCPVSRAARDTGHGEVCRLGARVFEAAELYNALSGGHPLPVAA
jgi:hypothetical protein